jgi:hypothetical protein
MKTPIYQTLTRYVIPAGEGFIALPSAFKYVIASFQDFTQSLRSQ